MSVLTLIITDATGSKEQQATVPADAPVIRVIAKLIELMQLPLTGPDGQPLSYKFHHAARADSCVTRSRWLRRALPTATSCGWSRR